MKLTLNLIRHGKTPGNIRGAYVGWVDHPLAPEGVEELQELVRKGIYPPVQMVFCSPLLRCRQTAETIYPGVAQRVIDDLRERNFGDFEDKTHDEIIAIPGYEGWGMTPESMTFPGGEEEKPFYKRCIYGMQQVIDQCVQEHITDAAIVAHGGVIMSLMCSVEGRREYYYHWFVNNGRGYRLICDTDSGTIQLQGSLGD